MSASSYKKRRTAELRLGNLAPRNVALGELVELASGWAVRVPGCLAENCKPCDSHAQDINDFVDKVEAIDLALGMFNEVQDA